MFSKLFNVFFLLLAIQNICSATLRRKHHIDVTQYNSAYYNPSNGIGLKAELEDSGRHPFSAKIAFRGLSCQCEELVCNCCAGVNITAFKFDRVACTKFTYDPQEFTIKLAVVMNEKEIYTNAFNAKNPPPICIPFPYVPILNLCLRLYDIHTVGKNLHTCIDLETRIVGAPILILHFDCVKMGTDGITWSKPEESNNQATPQIQQQIAEPEVYDEVDFEPQDLEVYSNHSSTHEEEAQIGQLKL